MELIPVPADGPEAHSATRAYLGDIIGRCYGRPATPLDIDAELAGTRGSHLTPPHGMFLLARSGDGTAGCVGVRLTDPRTAGMTRLWVRPEVRGAGLGSQLISAAEAAAHDLGASLIRMDTRSDLRAARRLYARTGYTETAPHHQRAHADHFFEKRLTP